MRNTPIRDAQIKSHLYLSRAAAAAGDEALAQANWQQHVDLLVEDMKAKGWIPPAEASA